MRIGEATASASSGFIPVGGKPSDHHVRPEPLNGGADGRSQLGEDEEIAGVSVKSDRRLPSAQQLAFEMLRNEKIARDPALEDGALGRGHIGQLHDDTGVLRHIHVAGELPRGGRVVPVHHRDRDFPQDLGTVGLRIIKPENCNCDEEDCKDAAVGDDVIQLATHDRKKGCHGLHLRRRCLTRRLRARSGRFPSDPDEDEKEERHCDREIDKLVMQDRKRHVHWRPSHSLVDPQ